MTDIRDFAAVVEEIALSKEGRRMVCYPDTVRRALKEAYDAGVADALADLRAAPPVSAPSEETRPPSCLADAALLLRKSDPEIAAQLDALIRSWPSRSPGDAPASCSSAPAATLPAPFIVTPCGTGTELAAAESRASRLERELAEARAALTRTEGERDFFDAERMKVVEQLEAAESEAATVRRALQRLLSKMKPGAQLCGSVTAYYVPDNVMTEVRALALPSARDEGRKETEP